MAELVFELPRAFAENLTLTGGISGIANRISGPTGDSEATNLGTEIRLRLTWAEANALSLSLFDRGIGTNGRGCGGSVTVELSN
ncbi:hypothetical protein [Pseudoroseicyclus sp. CXY001]|uniref:hypothetical protein n=1 Tax=Pseudoroseicyclus sp. CXY001 TaxID=3242492 RepID=UPI00357116E5